MWVVTPFVGVDAEILHLCSTNNYLILHMATCQPVNGRCFVFVFVFFRQIIACFFFFSGSSALRNPKFPAKKTK